MFQYEENRRDDGMGVEFRRRGGENKMTSRGDESERRDAVARLASDEEVRAVDGVRGRGARTTI